MKALAIAALLVLPLAACGSSDSEATPKEKADRIAADFYDAHRTVMDAYGGLSDVEPAAMRTFEPETECVGAREEVTMEAANTIETLLGQTISGSGSDVATFIGDLRQYRKDILATGVCDGA